MPCCRWTPAATCLSLAAALGILVGVSSTERSPIPSSQAASSLSKCCPESETRPALNAITTTPWLPPAQRVKQLPREVRVGNQDGEQLRLSNLIGQPLAISFVYTRCTNPNKCVRVMQKAAELEAALEKSGLDTKVRLLVFTYDPEFDSPAVLKSYGESHSFRFGPNAMMLRIDPADKASILDRFEIAVNFNSEGVNVHGLQLLVLDANGFLARVYHTVIWNNDEVLQDLRRLAAEHTALN